MEPSHVALAVLGVVSFAEALWGITSPKLLQEAVRRAVKEIPERNPGVGLFFGLLAGALWLLMSPEQRLSDWMLVVLSWVFAGGAYINFKRGGFELLTRTLILDRHPSTVRLMYTCEMLLALAMLYVALGRL